MPVPYDEAISRISTYLARHPLRPRSHRDDLPTTSPNEDGAEVVNIPIEHSIGRILARDYRATINAPPFDNSAMDGYVLSSHLTTHASPSNPITFKVVGSIAAGDEPLVIRSSDASTSGRRKGQDEGLQELEEERACYEIMTGAPFPIVLDDDDTATTTDERGSKMKKFDSCVRHESVLIPANGLEHVPLPPNTTTPTSFPRTKYITLDHPLTPSSNRKPAGEDFKMGDLLAKEGEEVSGGTVMVLASTGVSKVSVRTGEEDGAEARNLKRSTVLRVGVLTTGKEVAHNHHIGSGFSSTPATETTETGLPHSALEKGHIFNSNAPYLLATLRSWGHHPILVPAPREDTAAGFQECLRRASGMESKEGDDLDLDLIITTGGVSAGKHDYVPGSVLDLGGEIVFHKTFIRPGFPVLFGDIPKRGGGERLPIFGLPGNPIAVAACLRFLVVEFLDGGEEGGGQGIKWGRLLPSVDTVSSSIKATDDTLRATSLKKPLMTRCFMPARYHAHRPANYLPLDGEHSPPTTTPNSSIPDPDLIPRVEPLTRSASLTKAMSEANCWVVLPEGKEVYEEGEVVELVGMRP